MTVASPDLEVTRPWVGAGETFEQEEPDPDHR